MTTNRQPITPVSERERCGDWCEDYREVTLYGAYLLDEGATAEQLQDYYEHPWDWTEERAACGEGKAVCPFEAGYDMVDERDEMRAALADHAYDEAVDAALLRGRP